MVNFQEKDVYTIDDLLKIVRILRSPQGCPWDREQTHKSVRSNLIEETYEAVEAIDTSNSELLCEELGDVLLQVLFHSRMEEEAGGFSFDDVVDGVAKKLILRHPHVFGDTIVHNTDDVLRNWDAIKKKSKEQKNQTEVLQSVSPALPAVMRAAKIQKKAEKSGVNKVNRQQAAEHVQNCAKYAMNDFDKDSIQGQKAAGELLFSAVQLARLCVSDPEMALAQECGEFISHFAQTEQQAQQQGITLSPENSEQLNALWNQTNKKEINSQMRKYSVE